MSEGYLVGDGSWNLRVYVTDLQVERSLRVKGDLHIGGVMLKLVEDLGNESFSKWQTLLSLQSFTQSACCISLYCSDDPPAPLNFPKDHFKFKLYAISVFLFFLLT